MSSLVLNLGVLASLIALFVGLALFERRIPLP